VGVKDRGKPGAERQPDCSDKDRRKAGRKCVVCVLLRLVSPRHPGATAVGTNLRSLGGSGKQVGVA